MKFVHCFCASVAFASAIASAQTLYTTSTREYFAPQDVVGRLYKVDPSSGFAQELGPLKAKDGPYVGVIGLAVHPTTHVLYGIASSSVAQLRPSLASVEPATATVVIVGPTGHPIGDMNFTPDGKLYGWLLDSDQLGTIDLRTGTATPVGPAPEGGATVGAGFAIDGEGIGYVASTTAVGTIDTVALASGARTPGPQLTKAPYLSAIHSLTFSPSGQLYGVNTDLAVPARSELVLVDPQTGAVSLVGKLPDDAKGLAFSPQAVTPSSSRESLFSPWMVGGFVTLGAMMLAALLLHLKLRRKNPAKIPVH
jgi:hypothetical protein